MENVDEMEPYCIFFYLPDMDDANDDLLKMNTTKLSEYASNILNSNCIQWRRMWKAKDKNNFFKQ